jgi:hypothetical protein
VCILSVLKMAVIEVGKKVEQQCAITLLVKFTWGGGDASTKTRVYERCTARNLRHSKPQSHGHKHHSVITTSAKLGVQRYRVISQDVMLDVILSRVLYSRGAQFESQLVQRLSSHGGSWLSSTAPHILFFFINY